MLGHINRAMAVYEQGVEAHPENAVIAYNYGRCLVQTHDWDGAVAQWKRCLALNDEFIAANLNIALVYERNENISGAIEEIEKVLAADAGNEQARAMLTKLKPSSRR